MKEYTCRFCHAWETGCLFGHVKEECEACESEQICRDCSNSGCNHCGTPFSAAHPGKVFSAKYRCHICVLGRAGATCYNE
jgi:hypothetical protein